MVNKMYNTDLVQVVPYYNVHSFSRICLSSSRCLQTWSNSKISRNANELGKAEVSPHNPFSLLMTKLRKVGVKLLLDFTTLCEQEPQSWIIIS